MPAPTTATRREALALGMRAGLLVKHCKLLECSVAGYKEGADHGPVAEDLEILTCLVVVNDFEKKNLRYPIAQRTERRKRLSQQQRIVKNLNSHQQLFQDAVKTHHNHAQSFAQANLPQQQPARRRNNTLS